MTNKADALTKLVAADTARKMVLGGVQPVGGESIAIGEAANRILCSDLAALRTQPPFDASAMDGYALLSSDVTARPLELEVVGEAAAGHPFQGKVESGQAVRIFTGAKLPEGADTIAIQENVVTPGGNRIEVLKAEVPGKFIRKAGLDFQEGQILLRRGDILNQVTLSLAASMNHATLPVYSKPRVSLIATGDELVMPGGRIAGGQIIASNSFGIKALAQACGAEVTDHGIAKDTMQALTEKITAALDSNADLVITMGGASVGDHDLVKPAFEQAGFEFHLARIAMRPGKPFLFATARHNCKTVYLTGLAGNPVSSLVAAQVFVRPLIQSLGGLAPEELAPLPGVLGCDLPQNDEREEYMRASLANQDGTSVVTPFDRQDSSMLANMARAKCLLIRPANAPAAKSGDNCRYILAG